MLTVFLLAAVLQASKDEHSPAYFDLAGVPPRPASSGEQRIDHSPEPTGSPALLAYAHRQLARYYATLDRADLAAGEYMRAALADPRDHRAYEALAALGEALGAEAGDGEVTLREVARKLKARNPANRSEPAPARVRPDLRARAEFSQRMAYLFASPAWNGLARTLCPVLSAR